MGVVPSVSGVVVGETVVVVGESTVVVTVEMAVGASVPVGISIIWNTVVVLISSMSRNSVSRMIVEIVSAVMVGQGVGRGNKRQHDENCEGLHVVGGADDFAKRARK